MRNILINTILVKKYLLQIGLSCKIVATSSICNSERLLFRVIFQLISTIYIFHRRNTFNSRWSIIPIPKKCFKLALKFLIME